MDYDLMGREPSLVINSAGNPRAPALCSAQMNKMAPALGDTQCGETGSLGAQRRHCSQAYAVSEGVLTEGC